jgi:hypothetical protein
MSIFIHLCLVLCSIFVNFAEPQENSRVFGDNYTSVTSIFAIFMSDYNSTRIPDLVNYLKESRIPQNIDFEYWFINYTRRNVTELRSVYPPDEYRAAMKFNPRFKRFRRDLDLSSKFFFSLRFFELNSTARWLYRATDDTIINFPNLLPFMRFLERQYNPLTETAIIGNCMDIKRFSYLQGGSGILFSRYAALKLVNARDEFLSKLNRPEDVFLVKYLEEAGGSLYGSTSEYFIGHDILAEHRLLIWNKSLNLLPGCPDPGTIWRRECRTFVSPLKDIVFWHQEGYNKTLAPTIGFSRMVLSQPRHIMWWLNRGRPTLCQGRPLPRAY